MIGWGRVRWSGAIFPRVGVMRSGDASFNVVFAELAQLVEQPPRNGQVGGSTPLFGTIFGE